MRSLVNIFLCFFALLAAYSCTQSGGYVTITGFAQGGTYTVKINTDGVTVPAEEIRDSIDCILKDIDNSLSGYNRKSVLSRFNSGEAVLPDALFTEIYAIGREVFDLTGGAVDVAAAPLFDIWGFGFANDSLP